MLEVLRAAVLELRRGDQAAHEPAHLAARLRRFLGDRGEGLGLRRHAGEHGAQPLARRSLLIPAGVSQARQVLAGHLHAGAQGGDAFADQPGRIVRVASQVAHFLGDDHEGAAAARAAAALRLDRGIERHVARLAVDPFDPRHAVLDAAQLRLHAAQGSGHAFGACPDRIESLARLADRVGDEARRLGHADLGAIDADAPGDLGGGGHAPGLLRRRGGELPEARGQVERAAFYKGIRIVQVLDRRDEGPALELTEGGPTLDQVKQLRVGRGPRRGLQLGTEAGACDHDGPDSCSRQDNRRNRSFG